MLSFNSLGESAQHDFGWYLPLIRSTSPQWPSAVQLYIPKTKNANFVRWTLSGCDEQQGLTRWNSSHKISQDHTRSGHHTRSGQNFTKLVTNHQLWWNPSHKKLSHKTFENLQEPSQHILNSLYGCQSLVTCFWTMTRCWHSSQRALSCLKFRDCWLCMKILKIKKLLQNSRCLKILCWYLGT